MNLLILGILELILLFSIKKSWRKLKAFPPSRSFGFCSIVLLFAFLFLPTVYHIVYIPLAKSLYLLLRTTLIPDYLPILPSEYRAGYQSMQMAIATSLSTLGIAFIYLTRKKIHTALSPLKLSHKILDFFRITLLAVISAQFIPALVEYFLNTPIFDQGYRDLHTQHPLSDLIFFFVLCILMPLNEELVFRASLQRYLCSWMSPFRAIVYSSLSFCFAHINFSAQYSREISKMLVLFTFSAAVGALYQQTRQIFLPILSHISFNLVSWIIITKT